MATFTEAETYYTENKSKLIAKLFNETAFSIDHQTELDQVSVLCETFGKQWSICFQNGTDTGDMTGQAVWWNTGSEDGIGMLEEILKSEADFSSLINDESHKELFLEELITDFIKEYNMRENFDAYFQE